MKKVLLTAAIAAAFAFGMVACNFHKDVEISTESTEQTEEVCNHECEHQCDHQCAEACTCPDSCAAKNCEGCPNHGTDKCCKQQCKGEKAECCKEGEHKCCKDGEKKCCKDGEKKECCKK